MPTWQSTPRWPTRARGPLEVAHRRAVLRMDRLTHGKDGRRWTTSTCTAAPTTSSTGCAYTAADTSSTTTTRTPRKNPMLQTIERSRCAGHRRRHRRPDGRRQSQAGQSPAARAAAGKSQRQAQRRHLHGHGRPEQRRRTRHATPEQYVREITIANDGIVNQKTVLAYAQNSYAMIEELDRWGVKFEKDETGDFAVKKVHHMGSYVLPMPEGHDIKKVLYKRLKRTRVEITNRLVVTRLLTGADGASPAPWPSTAARRLPRDPRQVGGALDRRRRPPGPAGVGLPVRHLREPDQCRRRLQHGLPRRRRAVGHRVLPDQPADQGLQRPGLRLCDRPLRRLHRPTTRASASSSATTGAAR
jgi:hypothetical protein